MDELKKAAAVTAFKTRLVRFVASFTSSVSPIECLTSFKPGALGRRLVEQGVRNAPKFYFITLGLITNRRKTSNGGSLGSWVDEDRS